MNYIYEEKFGNRGLFAYFWCVLDCLKNLNESDKLFVNLNNKTPYFDINYTKTNNVWEYYFCQPSDLNDTCYNQEHKIIDIDNNFVKNMLFSIDTNTKKYSLYDIKNQSIAKELVKKYIKFQPHILEKVANFNLNHFKNKKVIGIHVRGGEHFNSGHAKNQYHMLTLDNYFSKIDENLNNFDIIYLTSNDALPRSEFKKRYEDKVCFYDHKYLADSATDTTWLHVNENYNKI